MGPGPYSPIPNTESSTPRIAYFDCVGGASGDMLLAALIDAGLDADDLRQDLVGLGVSGWRLEAHEVVRSGLAGTQVRVHVEDPSPPRRGLADVESILRRSDLPAQVRDMAMQVFERLARVEAHVHGIAAEDVHFHEVGAVDAIVDVVGCAAGLRRLGVERAYASSLPLGTGLVPSQHGPLPLPAPATLAILAEIGAPTRPVNTDLELVTPTGAAILASVAEFSQPPMVIQAIGSGFGARELPWPNVVRLWLGEPTDQGLLHEQVTVIETNLDDCSPEQAGFAMERLLEAGALDVFFTPVQMKKNRPGVVLSVLAAPPQADALARAVLRETTSLGVRFRTMERLVCPRRVERINTRYGALQIKIKSIDGRDIVCPEYEECARVARERGVSIGAVYAEVLRAGAPLDR